MSNQAAGEKTEEATPRRRQDARKKGTVARSTELAGAASLMVCALLLPSVVSGIGKGLMSAFHGAVATPPTQFSHRSALDYLTALMGPALLAMAPLIGALMAVGLAVNFAQVGFHLSAEAMKPTFEKINPFAGLKRLFSARTIFEGVKAMFKFALFTWIAQSVLAKEWNTLSTLMFLPPLQAAQVIGSITHTILVRIAGVWMALAIVDYIFQKKQVDKQLRMTKDELKREMKEQEGSPEIKAALFQKRRKLLKGGLASRLKEAEVIVTNPTHFAVALKYDRSEMHAPMVIAKGQDYLALKIREIAHDLEVPIVENPPLARSLYKKCEPGDFIPRDSFAAVAEVLAYVYKSVKSAKSRAKVR